MRIAMISTPCLPVPPPKYGGTELVVWELVEGLREAGHEVTLYAAGECAVTVEARRLFEQCVWPPDPYVECEHAAWAVGDVIARGEADVVHSHVAAALPLARFCDLPFVYTLHHEREPSLADFYRRQQAVRFVAISERQRLLLPEVASSVVWHGLATDRYRLGPGGTSAVFLGRLAVEKGPHVALDVARRARVPIEIAGRPHWKDEEYFARQVGPRIARGGSSVHWLGEVDHAGKVPLLGRAAALLCPIAWEEPFGLVVAEAMLCGTPVLAFARGSLPELIEDGVTGWICRDEDEMTARLASLVRRGSFDRAACRARACERFSRERMVRDYVDIYRQVAREQERGVASDGVAAATAHVVA